MAESWIIKSDLPATANPQNIPVEASSLVIFVLQATRRYDPPHRAEFVDALIRDLIMVRDAAVAHIHADDKNAP